MVSPSMTTASMATAPSEGDVDLTTAAGYDDEQIRLMEELCIVIDENDKSLRPGTKKECTPPDTSLCSRSMSSLYCPVFRALQPTCPSIFNEC